MSFFWTDIRQNIKRFYLSCDAYQKVVLKTDVGPLPLKSLLLIDTPLKRVAVVDLNDPFKPASNTVILTLID